MTRARQHIKAFEGRTNDGEDASTEHHHAALWELEETTERAQAPMLRIEHALHPWVSFLIVPLFALANAGVRLETDLGAALGDPIVIAVILGLVIGKQLGITMGALVAVRSGAASLPSGVGWGHIYGAAWLGGIGFTMSLFIGSLAYGEGSAELGSGQDRDPGRVIDRGDRWGGGSAPRETARRQGGGRARSGLMATTRLSRVGISQVV